jgi:ubiquinone/menaquinone biosynthesis C-methylase UbiE
MNLRSTDLKQLAENVGVDWKNGPYYDEAEAVLEKVWPIEVWPYICDADFTHVVDLAAGHGRNSAKLSRLAEKITIVDINIENIDFCKARFADDEKFSYVRNNGYDLAEIESAAVTLLFCYDAMVHFDSDVIRSYLRETKRVLITGGKAFFHYSNYTENPTGDVHDNPGWRNFMSTNMFEHYAAKEGLEVITSQRHRPRYALPWHKRLISQLLCLPVNQENYLDSISILKK